MCVSVFEWACGRWNVSLPVRRKLQSRLTLFQILLFLSTLVGGGNFLVEQLLSFAKQSAFQLNWHKNTSAWYYQLSFRNNWYFVVEILQQLLSGFSQDINLDNCPSVSVNVAVKPSAYVIFVEPSLHEAPRKIEDSRLGSCL